MLPDRSGPWTMLGRALTPELIETPDSNSSTGAVVLRQLQGFTPPSLLSLRGHLGPRTVSLAISWVSSYLPIAQI